MSEPTNPPKEAPSSSDPKKDPGTTENNGEGQGSPGEPNENGKQAYRKIQSRADKAEAENSDLEERLAYLESTANEAARDKIVKEFLDNKGKDYPDVSAEDLARFATSPDDLEETAKYLQSKTEKIRQSTLAAARNVPEESMTAAEKEQALKELKPSRGSFQDFIRIKTTKLKG